jgi:hypothetical protein
MGVSPRKFCTTNEYKQWVDNFEPDMELARF